MSQKNYRRLTRVLFLLLAVFFFLLYLLMGSSSVNGPNRTGAPQWRERRLELGEVRVSPVRSGGFLVDSFPIPASTVPSAADFDENVIRCSTTVYNEGTEPVDVTASVYGTRTGDDGEANPGLHCSFYSYQGDEDPAGSGLAVLLAQPGWTEAPHGETALALHTRDDGPIRLEPGERRSIVLFFWTDAETEPALTDAVRSGYSVTVKLTSRAKL